MVRNATGFTPFQLVYGLEAVLPVQCEISSLKLAIDLLPGVDAPKFVATTSGKPPGPELSVAPFPFGIVAPTRDNGTSFPKIISKRDG